MATASTSSEQELTLTLELQAAMATISELEDQLSNLQKLNVASNKELKQLKDSSQTRVEQAYERGFSNGRVLNVTPSV